MADGTLAPSHQDWSNLDATADPAWFVRFLDHTRAYLTQAIERAPEQFFAFLEPRSGLRVLDVGSGTGVLLHALARLVGPEGQVVGVDLSRTMVDEASRRVPEGLPLEFRQMDALNLDFADASFDRALSSVVFQHLPDVERALAEMVRVTKPGGLVSIIEQDWDTLVADCGELGVTRRLLHHFSDLVPNGTIGRQLFRLFTEAGLADVKILAQAEVMSGPALGVLAPTLKDHLRTALAAGVLSADEALAWERDLDERLAAGTGFASFTMFRAVGRKV